MAEPILFPRLRERIKERREERELRRKERELAHRIVERTPKIRITPEEAEAALKRMPPEIREALRRG